MNLASLRQEYMRAGLSESDADRDPMRQFERWFEDALRAKLPLPNAMTLATVSRDGAPGAPERRRARRLRLLYELPQPQGPGDRRARAGLPGLHVVGARAPGAHHRPGREGRRRRLRCLLCHATGGLPPLRVGLGAEREGGLARAAGEGNGRGEGAVRRLAAAAGPLGWVSRDAGRDRVLAGARRPAARPLAVHGVSWKL